MNIKANNDTANTSAKSEEAMPVWLQLVRDHVRSLRFGTVQITIHESRVVQVERVEKLRFDKTGQTDG